MAVPFVVLAQALKAATMLNVTAASKPVLISSMQNTRALVTSVSAIVTRFFSPPDTPLTKSSPIIVSMHPSSANSCVTAFSLPSWRYLASSVSAGAGVELSCENFAVSCTVKNGKCVSTCSTYAHIRLTLIFFSSSSAAVRPPYVTPLSGMAFLGSAPATAFRSAVFP